MINRKVSKKTTIEAEYDNIIIWLLLNKYKNERRN